MIATEPPPPTPLLSFTDLLRSLNSSTFEFLREFEEFFLVGVNRIDYLLVLVSIGLRGDKSGESASSYLSVISGEGVCFSTIAGEAIAGEDS